MKALSLIIPLVLALAAASCREAPEAVGSGRVVDSIFPIDEEIRRFQADLPDTPVAFAGGAPSRNELVERFVAAVETADTAGLAPLVLDRSEFGFLYYPHTRFTAKPYELSPGLLWFQMQNQQSRGLTRLFRRMAGGSLDHHGFACEDDARAEGPNRVWEECRFLVDGVEGDTLAVRLFGSIVERGGVFKFVSFSNEL